MTLEELSLSFSRWFFVISSVVLKTYFMPVLGSTCTAKFDFVIWCIFSIPLRKKYILMSYWTIFANPEGVSVHINMDVYSVRLSGSLITGWWSISASPIRLISDITAWKLVLTSVKSESFTMSNFLSCGGNFKYLFMPWRIDSNEVDLYLPPSGFLKSV